MLGGSCRYPRAISKYLISTAVVEQRRGLGWEFVYYIIDRCGSDGIDQVDGELEEEYDDEEGRHF